MSAVRRALIAGNWKMHGLKASIAELETIVRNSVDLRQRLDLMICPPATLIEAFAAVADGVAIGGQDCHPEPFGAFTGDISAEMLADLGACAVIVGHSERRSGHHETDDEVRRKVEAAWRAGLTAILCVGESRDQRLAGRTIATVGAQLRGSLPDRLRVDRLVIAYEPVWAIGSGLTPTPADVAEVHGFIRGEATARLGDAGEGLRILYGGSVKPANAAELMAVAHVDGALVGGASLKAE
ncbi:MAG: triose-phosphate isomerase, partial [Xanthobacteraceae bacterium]|nr:triose-phosphate isomerase [Xanthobacteraceae bacterium]